jgi:hypothetical protein
VATLTKQTINFSGVGPTYAAAAGGGDAVTPDDRTFLHVKNGGGSPQTVTVATPGTLPGGLAEADVQVSVPAGGERMFGPFPAEMFADQNGLAQITYSGVVSVTVAALQLPRPT